MSNEGKIRVEVVYALPERQRLLSVWLPAGGTAREAVERSGILDEFPEIDPDGHPLGIFGRRCPPGQALRDGDRVEIYRPLKADPKDVRRELAARGKTMGRGGGGRD